MKCGYATPVEQFHGWECQITGSECILLCPNEAYCPAPRDDAEKESEPGQIKRPGS